MPCDFLIFIVLLYLPIIKLIDPWVTNERLISETQGSNPISYLFFSKLHDLCKF